MTDYVFRLPSPKLRGCQRTSTAGDSTNPLDQWLWPLQALFNTPSKKLGMDLADELHLRARAVNWAVRICITLQLPQLIIATASAYIHRFYMRKPLQKYSPKVMSATALFLATKVEEVPRKLEYVVREYLKVDEQGNEQQGSIPEDSNEFQVLKQQILYFEDILLRTLCFDLAIDHPYVVLVDNVRSMHESHSHSRVPNSSLSVELADRSKAKSITQSAWGFVNDSLLTPLCLVAKPELIAASAFLLAVSHRLSECPPSSDSIQSHSIDAIELDHYLNLPANEGSANHQMSEPWWKTFNVESVEEIYQVANAMLDQYELSVDDTIRGRAGKLARFPGPSLLCPPTQIVQTESSPQLDSDVTSPNITDHEKFTPRDIQSGQFNQDSTVTTLGLNERKDSHPEFMQSAPHQTSSCITSSDIPEFKEDPPSQDVEGTPKQINQRIPSVNLPDNEEIPSQQLESSSKVDYDVQSPVKNVELEKLRSQDMTGLPSNSTPARYPMSDNMDLDSSIDSNNSSRKSASPLDPNQSARSRKKIKIKKRSRSSEHSSRSHHRSKTPKLEHIPTASVETLPCVGGDLERSKKPHQFLDESSSEKKSHTVQNLGQVNTDQNLGQVNTDQNPGEVNTDQNLGQVNTDQNLGQVNTDQNLGQVNRKLSARDSASSLSDMEDGELD